MTSFRLPVAPFAALALLAALASGCGTSPCNGECPAGTVCDAVALACVPAGSDGGVTASACAADRDCTSAGLRRCELDSGRCVACLANADCPSGERCDLASFTCTSAGCDSNADCAGRLGTPFCSAAGACVECLTSADCPASGGVRRTCDLVQNRCVENPCTADLDCATDPGGRRCDTASGACVACLADADCSASAPKCDLVARVCVGCLDDTDCAGGASCNPVTKVCGAPGCATDAACAPYRCDGTTGECVGCLTGSDCTFGGVCANEACAESPTCSTDADCVWPDRCSHGECVGCVTDADCRGGLVCTNARCAEPAACAAPTECLSGRTCEGGACADAACTNDSNEPNDTADEATPTGPGHLDATLCPNDEDDYLLALAPGAGAQATVSFDPSGPAPSLELVAGPPGLTAPVEGTVSAPGKLVATLPVAPSGTRALVVRVFGGDGATTVAYSLDTRVDAGGVCPDDAREPDDATNEAPEVGPGAFDGVSCPLNQDWLAFEVPENDRLSATLSLTGAASGAATVELYSVQSGALHRDAYGFAQATDPFPAAAGGQRFWVLVRNLTSQRFTYTLTVQETPKPPDDDACGQATALPLDATTSGSTLGAASDGDAACGGTGGDVFYTLTLAQPSELHLDLTASSDAALELESTCDATSRIDCASSGGTSEHLAWEALPAGSYVVRVATKNPGEEGAFTLSVRESPAAPPPAGETCDGATALTPTNGVATATGSLGLATNDVLATCGTDGGDAVYALDLARDEHVEATLTAFDGASLTLVPADGCASATNASCAAAVPVSGSEVATIDRSALAAGDWRLVVDGGSAKAGAFTLKVELSDPVYPPTNDGCDGAVDLGPTQSGDTRGGGDDFTPACGSGASAPDEVYRLHLDADSEVRLQLTAAFDATISIVGASCEGGTPVACADGPNARVDLADVPAGDYFVWVDGYASASGPFTLDSDVGPAVPVPSNDLCANAAPVDLSGGQATVTGSTLSAADDLHPSCLPSSSLAGPDVAYAVDVPAGRTLHAVLDPTDFDGAIYALSGCSDDACLAASDGSFVAGGEETVDVANASGADESIVVVVDSYDAAAKGAFSLSFELR